MKKSHLALFVLIIPSALFAMYQIFFGGYQKIATAISIDNPAEVWAVYEGPTDGPAGTCSESRCGRYGFTIEGDSHTCVAEASSVDVDKRLMIMISQDDPTICKIP